MDREPAFTRSKIEKRAPRIDVATIENTPEPISLNGIVYMPQPHWGPGAIEQMGRKLASQPWLQKLLDDNKDLVVGRNNRNSSLRNAMRNVSRRFSEDEIERTKEIGSHYNEIVGSLGDIYFEFKDKHPDEEPEWFHLLDDETKKFITFNSVWDNEDRFSTRLRFTGLPYAGINFFTIEDQERFEEIVDVFNIDRLNAIKQLSLLREPDWPAFKRGEDFLQTRYGHSFDVLAVANLVAVNVGLSKEDTNLLQIAALTHDYRTPAGGDTTKLVDPDTFDEDKNYDEIFETKKWKDFAKKHGITKEQEEKLYKTIQGEGNLGRLLDLSDKSAYVARDVSMAFYGVGAAFNTQTELNTIEDYQLRPELQRVKDAIVATMQPCALWESVEIINGEVVITDGEKLAAFLEIRANLFRELYYNFWGKRISIFMILKDILKYLYDKGEITKERILSGGDQEIGNLLTEFLGVPNYSLFIKMDKFEVRSCESVEEAKRLAETFNDESGRIAVVDTSMAIFGTNSATSKFLTRRDGKVMPFNQAYPEKAEEIDTIATFPKTANVFVISFDDLEVPESRRAKIKEIFRVAA